MSVTARPPLWDPRFEHEACGLGALARLDGRPSHELVDRALHALEALEHRGASGADEHTGDGAGIMVQQPDRLLRRVALHEFGHDLPEQGGYATGLVFLPRDPGLRMRCEELCVRTCAEEGHRALGFRDVPVEPAAIGDLARASEPVIRQLMVERRSGDEDAFERKLYVIRRRIERRAAAAGVPEADFTVVSLSARRLVYKGLLRASQLRAYYPDLRDPSMESALAIVHSRFSTNTLGTWDLAHPFNLLAHNGEINTVRGNAAWLAAREPQLSSQLLGSDLQKLFPVAEDRWSDSAKLDAALELLVLSGRPLEHALTTLMPPAWTHPATDLDDDARAFCEYHAALMEPWDGPAAVIASDGRRVVAALDRSGLRPCRVMRTRDGLVAIASEVGVLGEDAGDLVECDRLEPGRLLCVDTVTGRVVGDRELRRGLARRRPYGDWLTRHRVHLDDLPAQPGTRLSEPDRERLARAFGYSREHMELMLRPLAEHKVEPVGSMGDDTPPAVLSDRPRLFFDHFRQLFAQVTNPPIDPVREGLSMSLQTAIGPIGNLLDERPEHCRRVVAPRPVLTQDELARLSAIDRGGLRAATVSTLYPVAAGPDGMERAVDELCRAASRAAWDGAGVVILSDRGVDAGSAAIPALLATAAVHSHLAREGARPLCGLVVDSAEPRETMHIALLLGYGAAAVCPYLALELAGEQHADGLVAGLSAGLLKICSKMGISTIQSYRGAGLFEAVGVGSGLVARYLPGAISRVGGVELGDVHAAVARLHAAGFGDAAAPAEGDVRVRVGGERHAWNADTIVALQRAVRDGDSERFARFAELVDGQATGLRAHLRLQPAVAPVPVTAVEPATAIVRRFATGAISLGAISPEAHETLAIAMNRLGGRSNSGEGGEDGSRSRPDRSGDLRRSAIKQVASARFGVTAGYLVDADQLQIKIAQGAKPGEGGQLPGGKVDATIARLRHSTPGVDLISPPPHHDIYSIEDLAQLIHDLRCVNPQASISVKLASAAGVGTIAAGVAKAGADHIVIAGADGGTGAAPRSSIRNAGAPWELGLAEAHQVLAMNSLRERVTLQVDGGMRTPRDVVVAALLGADEYAFATAPLVAAGCVMMRVCHLNTCPVGIATQDPELRRRFAGTPEHVAAYFLHLAEGVRTLLAGLGCERIDQLVGNTGLLEQAEGSPLDLSPLLHAAGGGRRQPQATAPRPLEHTLAGALAPALAGRHEVSLDLPVANTDRSVGTWLAGEIARRRAAGGSPKQITLRLTGAAGQSLAAFAPDGLRVELDGLANDAPGKGLCGGSLVVRPPRSPGADAVVCGNAALYGATAGAAFIAGRAGERFAVRNSGAECVVEGVGDHGCEYMTGGVAVVLGRIGRNFAAGMTGGCAYVLDPDGLLERNCNRATVEPGGLSDDDLDTVAELLARHLDATGSRLAADLLADWPAAAGEFVRVAPRAATTTAAHSERRRVAVA